MQTWPDSTYRSAADATGTSALLISTLQTLEVVVSYLEEEALVEYIQERLHRLVVLTEDGVEAVATSIHPEVVEADSVHLDQGSVPAPH